MLTLYKLASVRSSLNEHVCVSDHEKTRKNILMWKTNNQHSTLLRCVNEEYEVDKNAHNQRIPLQLDNYDYKQQDIIMMLHTALHPCATSR